MPVSRTQTLGPIDLSFIAGAPAPATRLPTRGSLRRARSCGREWTESPTEGPLGRMQVPGPVIRTNARPIGHRSFTG